jgi:hypothetical protein
VVTAGEMSADGIAVEDGPAMAGGAEDTSSWRRAVAIGLVTYVVSRLCVLLATGVRAVQRSVELREAGVVDRQSTVRLMSEVFTSWDGLWYLEIVRGGYPTSIPPDVTYFQDEARAAFFPVFPWVVDALDRVLPGGDTVAALFLNLVLGGVSVVLVGLLAKRVYSVRVASRAMVLYALFPGSFVLSFAYAEAMFIVLAGLCLLLLLDERWLLAGLSAAVATATRPNGLALVAACIAASALAIRRTRDWSSLSAVLLAPIGFIAFQLYIDDRVGERGAWFRVQREAWSEGTSFGSTALNNTWGFLTNPLESTTDALTAASLFTLIFMGWCYRKRPLPPAMLVYVVVIILLMIAPATVTARPRFIFTAFPLFISVAAWWPTSRDDDMSTSRVAWDLTLVLEGVGLVALTGLYGAFGAIP